MRILFALCILTLYTSVQLSGQLSPSDGFAVGLRYEQSYTILPLPGDESVVPQITGSEYGSPAIFELGTDSLPAHYLISFSLPPFLESTNGPARINCMFGDSSGRTSTGTTFDPRSTITVDLEANSSISLYVGMTLEPHRPFRGSREYDGQVICNVVDLETGGSASMVTIFFAGFEGSATEIPGVLQGLVRDQNYSCLPDTTDRSPLLPIVSGREQGHAMEFTLIGQAMALILVQFATPQYLRSESDSIPCSFAPNSLYHVQGHKYLNLAVPETLRLSDLEEATLRLGIEVAIPHNPRESYYQGPIVVQAAYVGLDAHPDTSWVTALTEYSVTLEPVPSQFRIFQNYPNPFNPGTNIRYEVPTDAAVTLRVYDILGREVKGLVDEHQAPGSYAVTWDGTTSSGTTAGSGAYFYRIVASTQGRNFSQVRKMLLMK